MTRYFFMSGYPTHSLNFSPYLHKERQLDFFLDLLDQYHIDPLTALCLPPEILADTTGQSNKAVAEQQGLLLQVMLPKRTTP